VSLDERVIAERISSIVNTRLMAVAKDVEQLRSELVRLRGEFEVVKREAIKSVTEAVLSVKVGELAARVEAALRQLAEGQEKLASELTGGQRGVADLAAKTSSLGEDIESIHRLLEDMLERLAAVEEAVARRDMPPALTSSLSELQARVRALEKSVADVAGAIDEMKPFQRAVESISNDVAALNQRVDKLAEALAAVREEIEYVYQRIKQAEEEKVQKEKAQKKAVNLEEEAEGV